MNVLTNIYSRLLIYRYCYTQIQTPAYKVIKINHSSGNTKCHLYISVPQPIYTSVLYFLQKRKQLLRLVVCTIELVLQIVQKALNNFSKFKKISRLSIELISNFEQSMEFKLLTIACLGFPE